MTVEANDTIERQTIDGTGPYEFSFRIFDESELLVYVDNGTDIDPTLLALTTHYSIDGVNDEEGGAVTLTSGAATTYDGLTIDIRSRTTRNQPTSFRNLGRFNNESHENAIDRLARQVQDLERIVRQCLRYPDTTALDAAMDTREAWRNKWVYVNDDGEFEPSSAITPQALTQSIIAGLLTPQNAREASVGAVVVNAQYPVGNVLRYGNNTTPGTTDMTAAFTAARNVTSGRYTIPTGTYLVDASPDVWTDAFIAEGATFIKIGSTTYTVSNAIAGRIRPVIASSVKTDWVDAVTGNTIQYWQNSQPGTATGFYRVLAVQVDSHWAQVSPMTENSSVDLLWQRSPNHTTDPAGNRINFTYDEANDRLLISYATTAMGAPSFDSAIQIYPGTSPSLVFPGLQPEFNQGWSVKQRAAGGFHMEIVSASSTITSIRNKGTPANINMSFGDGLLGFHGSTPTAKGTITGSRAGNAALASLLSYGANKGLWIDGTTA